MTDPLLWALPSRHPSLEDDEIHVWCLDLKGSPGVEQALLEILSTDERERAKRFHFQKHRHRFVIARGILRVLLARYLQAEPHQLRFDYGPNGKPSLAESYAQAKLRFNLAHSHEVGLYAMVHNRAIGINIEFVREDFDVIALASKYFSPLEFSSLCSLPIAEQKKAFFNCWTRKEAYIKAVGQGLSLSLDGFDVSLAPGVPAQLLSIGGEPQPALQWSLRELPVGSTYSAAVAVEGKIRSLKCWRAHPSKGGFVQRTSASPATNQSNH